MLSRSRLLTVVSLLGALALAHGAEPKAPPPPEQYDVLVRFQLDRFRNERYIQFGQMQQFFKEAGFQIDPEETPELDNPRFDTLHGTIASAKARLLLGESHVQTIRLGKVPEDKMKPVRVHLDLLSGLTRERQQRLRSQVREVVTALGFKEAGVYHERGFTRLVGVIPAGQVDTVAGDLRRLPAGWALLPKTLLGDLRNHTGGANTVKNILDDWYSHTDGRKLVRDAVALWKNTVAGGDYLKSLPVKLVESEEFADKIVVEVRLIYHMAAHADAGSTLQHLFTNVLESPAKRDLMDMLLRRVYTQQSGLELPLLFRVGSAIRVVEVFPDMPLPQERPVFPEVPPEQQKLTPDLREVLNVAEEAAKTRRLEIILALPPDDTSRDWIRALHSAGPGLVVEGRIGQLVSVAAPTNLALALAALPEVAVVRLPRPATPKVLFDPDRPRDAFLPLQLSGTDRKHQLVLKGRNQRAAVIAGDFRDWQKLVDGQLPKKTQLLDLTRERNPDLRPDQETGPADQQGFGTRYAIALMQAAPAAELTLIRIDPACPHMLQAVARAINGELVRTVSLDNRAEDLDNDRQLLGLKRDRLLEERKLILDDFGVDEETVKRRKDYFKRQAAHDEEERKLDERIRLYLQLKKDLADLKGIRIVASPLIWNEGYPVDGTSALSRYFDDQPFKAALWFQAVGKTAGQAWTGLFRDTDENGVMEFVAPQTRLKEDAWTPELNFLAWQPATGGLPLRELPDKTKLRLTLQWREAHDPEFLRTGDDPYREPLAKMRVVLMYQPDPKGAKQPADDLEVVAETVGPPQRLDAAPNGATYEHILQVRLPKPGRYVVRIEGTAPNSTRPRQFPTLPSKNRTFELRTRLYVETLEGPGRAIWYDHETSAGSIGMPGDAQRVITVGSAK
jgi:hypothetical protein